MKEINIRQAKAKDAARIAEIYNWYILNTIITFEIEPISSLEMRKRIEKNLEKYDWLVAEVDQTVVGYAYYDLFRSRVAFSHTVESTIYLAKESIGKGFGKALYGKLIDSAKNLRFRELVGVIALPNSASTALHHRMGFREMGVLKNVGYKFEQYIDVGLWQRSITESENTGFV
jgi:phosphinothricin acetyltransferase